ncbi:glycosyltransferase family 2 protein [uncultured Winogradskyella sp.]|uniref:glycosyltransferase family 2 protein n=1 Tax=uncultured Winogradskyella sp. TaxID=395353 RepID=UPI003513B893
MKVSIITATYNSAATIQDCMTSVLSQSYTNVEYLIMDGASTDATLARVEELKETYPDVCIKIYSEPDKGIYDALNKGISRATGDIIGFVHSDDLLASPKVVQQVVAMLTTQGCDGVYGDLKYVTQQDTDQVVRFWKSRPFHPKLLKTGWMPPHPTVFLKASVYEELGLFDTRYTIAADYDFLLRLFTTPHISMHYIPETITLMRLGGASNRSLKNIINKMTEDYKAITTHRVGGFGTLFLKTASKFSQFWKR